VGGEEGARRLGGSFASAAWFAVGNFYLGSFAQQPPCPALLALPHTPTDQGAVARTAGRAFGQLSQSRKTHFVWESLKLGSGPYKRKAGSHRRRRHVASPSRCKGTVYAMPPCNPDRPTLQPQTAYPTTPNGLPCTPSGLPCNPTDLPCNPRRPTLHPVRPTLHPLRPTLQPDRPTPRTPSPPPRSPNRPTLHPNQPTYLATQRTNRNSPRDLPYTPGAPPPYNPN
jgi:hypothetical protein